MLVAFFWVQATITLWKWRQIFNNEYMILKKKDCLKSWIYASGGLANLWIWRKYIDTQILINK